MNKIFIENLKIIKYILIFLFNGNLSLKYYIWNKKVII